MLPYDVRWLCDVKRKSVTNLNKGVIQWGMTTLQFWLLQLFKDALVSLSLSLSLLSFSLQANWRKKGTLYWLRQKRKKKSKKKEKTFHVFPSKVFGALFPPFLASILWQGLVRIIIQPHLSLSLSIPFANTHQDLHYCHLLRRHFCLYQKKRSEDKNRKKLENTFFLCENRLVMTY